MKQRLGKSAVVLDAVTADTGVPTGTDGLDVDGYTSGNLTFQKWLLRVTAASAVNADLYLWGKVGAVWAPLGDYGGRLNDGLIVPFSATRGLVYMPIIKNIGILDRLALEVRNISAAVEINADANIIIEQT